LEGLEIYIVGIPSTGIDGITKEGREIIEGCHVIFSSERFYKLLMPFQASKEKLKSFPKKLTDLPEEILKIKSGKVCVLATGDPNFFGITNFLKRYFPENVRKIIPALSIMQEAFARLHKNWEDAGFLSIHGRNKDELLSFLLKNKKGFIYTSNSTDVLFLLRYLKELKLTDYTVFILEHLGTEKEKITKVGYPYYVKEPIADLNVVLFEREDFPSEYIGLGLEDDCFEQEKGMITKKEVRCIILSLLQLKPGVILWDIGAGTGSVSIEASFNPIGVLAYAIEKNEKTILNMKKNIAKYKAVNVVPLFSDFKDIVDNIPKPHRIFIGGSGGEIEYVVNKAYSSLLDKGIIVASAVSVDTLNTLINFCKKHSLDYELTGVTPLRGKKVKKNLLFDTQNTIFLIRIKK
jgi:precorrin-6Y C5,15-methyltransferase (decarboxylating)